MNDDDLVIEVDDETHMAVTRMAEARGIPVDDMARLLVVDAVRNDKVASSQQDAP